MRVFLIVLMVCLVWIAVALFLVGGYYLTEITGGVGGIAGACFLGILARMVQASIHHRQAIGGAGNE